MSKYSVNAVISFISSIYRLTNNFEIHKPIHSKLRWIPVILLFFCFLFLSPVHLYSRIISINSMFQSEIDIRVTIVYSECEFSGRLPGGSHDANERIRCIMSVRLFLISATLNFSIFYLSSIEQSFEFSNKIICFLS